MIRRILALGLISLTLAAGVAGAADIPATVVTVAGGGSATASYDYLSSPSGLAKDPQGNIYIADTGLGRVRKVAPDGKISTIAGDGGFGFSGDMGPAVEARFNFPLSVAVDSLGNVYVADTGNNRVRKIDTAGIISTFAGNGAASPNCFQCYLGSSAIGDGGPAVLASLWYPTGLAVGPDDDLYIADTFNYRIRRIDSQSGHIATVAGNGFPGYAGDGGPATAAGLRSPYGVSVDQTSSVFISDKYDHRIRRVDGVTGSISTIAGTGSQGYSGDGGPAGDASLSLPHFIAVDPAGGVLVADEGNQRVRRISPAGIVSTIAGNGTAGWSGDGGPATAASLRQPLGVLGDGSSIYIADTSNNRLRRVEGGLISSTAGTTAQLPCCGDDNMPPSAAYLSSPSGVTVAPDGSLYLADSGGHRVIRFTRPAIGQPGTGLARTVAGGSGRGFSGDGGDARLAKLDTPVAVAFNAAGEMFIADAGNYRIRKVDTSGTMSTYAGTGAAGSSGDGGPAIGATMNRPEGLVTDPAGNLYIADRYNNRVRRVQAQTGTISTFAGPGSGYCPPPPLVSHRDSIGSLINGYTYYCGDSGPATLASLYQPTGLAMDAGGQLFIADMGNNRIRKVTPQGTISTVAGNGTRGASGDGGRATEPARSPCYESLCVYPASSLLYGAQLNFPFGVAVDRYGVIYIADSFNNRIRKVGRDGVISTIAGNGMTGQPSEGMAAVVSPIGDPRFIAVDALGDVFVVDSGGARLRKVAGPQSPVG